MNIIFHVAAGPRIGFGHLMRCRTLARVLGVRPVVSIRGGRRAKRVAQQTGWRVISLRQLSKLPPSVVVIDEPSGIHTHSVAERARQAGHRPMPIAGLAIQAPYAVIDPAIISCRDARAALRPRVLIALGGGAHVFPLAGQISRALATRVERLTVIAASGFSGRSRKPALARGRWIDAPNGLKKEFARATVAVVAGGVTLQEACAAGVPVVAFPVVSEQRPAIRRLAARGAVVRVGRAADIGRCVARLIDDRFRQHRLSAAAKQAVDGLGVFRIACRIKRLAHAA